MMEEQQLRRSWWPRKVSGLPHFWLAGAGAGVVAAGQGQDWQEQLRELAELAGGGLSHFHTGPPPTMLQPSACVGALIGGRWTIYGSDHGRCGPMGMARTAALASTRASAEAPRASISHSTCFTVQLPYHYHRSGLESHSSAGLFPESCIVCMTRND
jgi:hypothetical protein